jgi:hypothetical protein
MDATTASAEKRAKFEKRPSNNPEGVNGGGRKKGSLRTGAYLKQAAERNVRKKKMRWWSLLLQQRHERQQESLSAGHEAMVRGLHELHEQMEGLLRTRAAKLADLRRLYQRLDVERQQRQLQLQRQERPALRLRLEPQSPPPQAPTAREVLRLHLQQY